MSHYLISVVPYAGNRALHLAGSGLSQTDCTVIPDISRSDRQYVGQDEHYTVHGRSPLSLTTKFCHLLLQCVAMSLWLDQIGTMRTNEHVVDYSTHNHWLPQ